MQYVFFHPQKSRMALFSFMCFDFHSVYICILTRKKFYFHNRSEFYGDIGIIWLWCSLKKFFAALALHLHHIRTVIVYTCIISYVTISMFKIGFSQKGWTFSPRVVPDFFQARLFLFWAISDFGGFAVGRNTSALTQWLLNKKSNTQKNVLIAY